MRYSKMIEQDYEQFRDLYIAANALTSSTTPAEGTISFAFGLLMEFTFEEVRAAMFKQAQSSKFFPHPSEIRKLLLGDPDTAAMKAWQEAKRIATQIGGAFDLVYEDQVFMQCVKVCGGLQDLTSMKSDEELNIFGHDFRRAYKDLKLNPPANMVEVLEGSHNRQAKLYGRPLMPPRRIGVNGEVKQQLPDMSKPRYPELQNPKPATREDASRNIRKLMSLIKEPEATGEE